MSLFGSIQLGANTLRAMQIGLQVTGNNIANANTPGFVRQEVIYSPAPVQKIGNLTLGLGVQVDAIVDKIDKFVLNRLVGARGDRAGADVQEEAYTEIENLLNGLSGETDLSTEFTNFINSIGGVLGDPNNPAARNLVITLGDKLAGSLNSLSSRATSIREEFNDRIVAAGEEINSLTETIRKLNVQISTVEGSGASASDAGGLRVERQKSVDRLSEILGITVNEQTSGAVNIAVGGEILVFEGQRQNVEVVVSTDGGLSVGTIQFSTTHSPLESSSGELPAMYAARDEIVGDFLDGLDQLAGLFAFEFNKLHSQGQGRVGFDDLVSVNAIADADAALDEAGLAFAPVSGHFELLVYNPAQNITETHDVFIQLDGLDDDTTLNDLTAALDAIDGISASITSAGKLEINSDSNDTEFAFDDDSSGVLAALGLNTFFTGSTARDIAINNELRGLGNEAKFAASGGGLGTPSDSANALVLSKFLDQSLDSAGGLSVPDVYDRLVNTISQGATVAGSIAEGLRVFENTLDGQQQAVAGVSLDEEAINLITLQRIYQASARFIQTAAEMLDVLINL
ncbi:MAG: flagellar hook-associated protein FlgK [Pirellulales bacterium]